MPATAKRGRSHVLTGAPHIPRPPNSWILFRSYCAKTLRDEGITLPRNVASKTFAQKWRSLSAADKKPYEELAKQAKQEHERAHPDYKYRPLTKAMKARMLDEGSVEDEEGGGEERKNYPDQGKELGHGWSMANAFGAGTPLGQPQPAIQTVRGIPLVPSGVFQGVVDANATFRGNATGQYDGQGENILYQGNATHQGYYIPFNFPLPSVQGPNAFAQADVDLQQQLQAFNNVFGGVNGSSGGSSSLGINHHHHHHQAAQMPPLAYYDAQALAQYNLAEPPVDPLQIEIGQTAGPAEVFENFELWAWGGGDDKPGQGEGGGGSLCADLAEPSDTFIPTPSSSQTSTSPVNEGELHQQPLYDISNAYDEASLSESSACPPVQSVTNTPFDGAPDKTPPGGGSLTTEVYIPTAGFRFEDWVDL